MDVPKYEILLHQTTLLAGCVFVDTEDSFVQILFQKTVTLFYILLYFIRIVTGLSHEYECLTQCTIEWAILVNVPQIVPVLVNNTVSPSAVMKTAKPILHMFAGASHNHAPLVLVILFRHI
jgi:hypothetical protein